MVGLCATVSDGCCVWLFALTVRSTSASLEDYDKGEDIEVLRSKYKEALPHNDTNRTMVWAGAGVGEINEIKQPEQVEIIMSS